MASKKLSKLVKHSALSLAIGMCLASPMVLAQSSVGSMNGTADAGAPVTITNESTGFKREILADDSGRFSFSQLAPGTYKVAAGGVTRDVVVRVGTGSSVNLASSSSLETITVVGSELINPIDMASVESATVFNQEQIQQLPIARDITNVALLAPGTVKGDTGFGNLASFGGSSVAENGYYVNGFDVTNIFNFLSYSEMPFDAISEQQIKTGGYGAEYGRSLGGVISLVTKRGTNEWTGGASLYWSPSGPASAGRDAYTLDQAAAAEGQRYLAYRSDDKSDFFSLNVYGGGPIIEDRLFVFGLIEAKHNTADVYDDDNSRETTSDRPNGLLKLDWNLSDNHMIEATAITNRRDVDYVLYRNDGDDLFTGEHGSEFERYSYEYGGEVFIAKYTGYLTDSFTLSAQYGELETLDGRKSPALTGADACSRAYDSRANPAETVYVGCYNEDDPFVRDQTAPADSDTREAWRIDGDWLLGDHRLRFGLDSEKFVSQRAGTQYAGDGFYYRYFNRTSTFTDSAVGVTIPANTPYVRTWQRVTQSGGFEINNEAFYLEDNWQATDQLMLYLGARAERFENFNADGVSFADSGTLWAPRLGFSWDVKGDGSLKVFGNAGRYYIPIAGNTSVRMAGGESGTAVNYYYWDGELDEATGLPANGLGDRINAQFNEPHLVVPNPQTVAATNLSPMYQDEFILGAQFQMPSDWTIGARAISREVKAGMDDICMHQPLQRWAEENGYDDVQLAANYIGGPSPTCYMINPGEDVSILVDLYGDGSEVVEADIPASYFGLPEYTRKYTALEVFFERQTDTWFMQGSYTWGKSRGTSEGYVNSTLEQTDAGITQDFDFRPFTDGTYGNLPNDRRHSLKLFGAYDITDEWRLSGNVLIQSGRPVSCYGYIPLDDASLSDDELDIPVYDWYVASFWSGNSFYCDGDGDGDSELGNRGDRGRTPWVRSLDAGVAYMPKWADQQLAFEVKVFNVFNNQSVTEYYEFSQRGGSGSPEPEPDFLNAVNYQAPRSVQFVVRYEF